MLERLRSRLLIVLSFYAVLVAGATLPLSAAPSDKDETSYRDLVKRASTGDASVDFRAFRIACLKASKCDPGGDDKELLAMQRAIQAKDFRVAAKACERVIGRGFVNIVAHVVCSQAYEGLKNADRAKFHHDIAASLIRSILATGDGKTEETAFEVIDTSEEYLIMSVLGLPAVESQSLIPGKPHRYDVLRVDDPRTGQKTSVFFNIDLFFPPKDF